MSDRFKTGVDAIDYTWEDQLGNFLAANIDTSSGRIDYDYPNGAVGYANNARYPDEPVVMKFQFKHGRKEGSPIRPHIHWLQQSSNIPNWLFAYKKAKNGQADVIETDYSNYTLATISSNIYTYTSGVLRRISEFPEIDMAGYGLSDFILCVLFRDTGNASGQFAGADPSSLVEYVTDMDIHVQIDGTGSIGEYVKQP